MLDSILKRHKDPIKMEKVILPDRVITDKAEIKEHFRLHFKHWMRRNPPNEEFQNNTWTDAYKPLDKINPNIYTNVLEPISMEEMINTINIASKKKATGPSGISNEILQHLPQIALIHMNQIMN